MDLSHVQHIVVVKLRTLGDILTTFPLIRALKEIFPQAQLTFIADETYRDLFAAHPRVDVFWGHPLQRLSPAAGRWDKKPPASMVAALRQKPANLYIDLYGSLRTALWGALAHIPIRMGFNLRGRKYFYTQQINALHRYVVDLNLQFAQALGWQGNQRALEFFITAQDQTASQSYMRARGWRENQPYVVIAPGGGWPLKCWPPERFGYVARRLVQHTGCQICFSGTTAEKNLIDLAAQALAGPYIPLIGLPLRQLAAVIQGSRLFLGNDSGPKYFAEAFQVPTLICYGPTDFINNNPNSPDHLAAYFSVPCRPCHSEKCLQEKRICLDDLSEEEVLALALQLWDRPRHS